MVWRDVQQDGDVGTEVVHVVQLERAQFYDIVFVRILGHLKCQRVSDIAGQTCIVACFLEDVVDQRGGRGLTV